MVDVELICAIIIAIVSTFIVSNSIKPLVVNHQVKEWSIETHHSVINFTPIKALNINNECNRLYNIGKKKKMSISSYITMNKKLDNTILVTMNGMNEGFIVNSLQFNQCKYTFSRNIAESLNVNPVDLLYPLYLYHKNGVPLDPINDNVHNDYIHIVLQHDSFMFSGVAVGYKFKIGGAELETISLRPKIILAKNALTNKECVDIIDSGRKYLSPSGEKHYSDAYKDWRTSMSGGMSAQLNQIVRDRSQLLARTVSNKYPEHSSMVYYNKGNRYRKHHDRYHNFKWNTQKLWYEWIDSLQIEYRKYSNNHHHHSEMKSIFKEDGKLYPTRLPQFQTNLFDHLLKSNHERLVSSIKQSYDLKELISSKTPIFEMMKKDINVFPLVQNYWLNISSNIFGKNLLERMIEPNRFATLFYYLNSANGKQSDFFLEGGETVFPLSNNSMNNNLIREGVPECSRGIYIKPVRGAAALFYNILPENGKIDDLASHVGCPPQKGEKFGINSFIWNMDSQYGYKIYSQNHS